MKDNVLKGVKITLFNKPSLEAFKGAFVFNKFTIVNSDLTKGWTFADEKLSNPFGA